MSGVDYSKDSNFPAQQASFLSMRNVSAGNRAAWLELFADDALVQDPVGVSPLDPAGLGHRGKEAIGRFWYKGIARQHGLYAIRESHPCADECANVLTVTQTRPDGNKFDINFVVVYRVDGAGRIVSLKAYWQFEKMMQNLARLSAGQQPLQE
ncbi:MAG: nuclear transport factor 2 family protein [Betaproteobacteria bacterium]